MAMTLNEDNTLILNFPTLPTVLNNVLTKSLNEEQDIYEIHLKEAVVDAYLFAADFFVL